MENTAFQIPLKTNTDLDQQVMARIEKVAEVSLNKLGQPCKASSKNSVKKFLSFPEERKTLILEQVTVMDRILAATEKEPVVNPNEHPEWPLIQQSLDFYGLHLKDEFKSKLHRNDVIEVYNAEHIQIFRSFNFYKYSAYSFLDLLVNEWFNLWQRPTSILEALIAVGQQVVSGKTSGVVSIDHVPQHVYKEIYNSQDADDFEVRNVQCKFGHICPLYKSDNTIGGFIVNCRVQVIGFGEETQKLSFI